MSSVSDWNFNESVDVGELGVDWEFTDGYLTVTVVRVGEPALQHTWPDRIPQESVGTLEEMKERVQVMALEILADMLANPGRFKAVRPAD